MTACIHSQAHRIAGCVRLTREELVARFPHLQISRIAPATARTDHHAIDELCDAGRGNGARISLWSRRRHGPGSTDAGVEAWGASPAVPLPVWWGGLLGHANISWQAQPSGTRELGVLCVPGARGGWSCLAHVCRGSVSPEAGPL